MVVTVRPAPTTRISGLPEAGERKFKSPPCSPLATGKESWYVPAGRLIVAPVALRLACITAARSVHLPDALRQMPSPRLASTSSTVLLTVKMSAACTGGGQQQGCNQQGHDPEGRSHGRCEARQYLAPSVAFQKGKSVVPTVHWNGLSTVEKTRIGKKGCSGSWHEDILPNQD